MSRRTKLTCLELCAGAGGQALGLEAAGFAPLALVDNELHCCATLRINRPYWNTIQQDLETFDAKVYRGVDLVAGGLPCPPFSVAGKQLGKNDERDMFPHVIRIIEEALPQAIMIENVKGFLNPIFEDYRSHLEKRFDEIGYKVTWKLVHASDFGVPQLRPRVVIVGFRKDYRIKFDWPKPQTSASQMSVGNTLFELMAARGWEGIEDWRKSADCIAPTIVGGSLKHGGPDLGPTRAKKAWRELRVDGLGIANTSPDPGFEGMPMLTVEMVAKLQGFPEDWVFAGKKTAAYRQVGNAFPPPVAAAVANQIRLAISGPSAVAVNA